MRNYTDLTVILDHSRTFRKAAPVIIRGFNAMLTEQSALEGELVLTLAQFDNTPDVLYEGVPLPEVKRMTEASYRPRNQSAVLDTIGRMITNTGQRLREIPEDGRPDKVVIMVITDGEDTASSTFTIKIVKGLIEHQAAHYNWQFIFMSSDREAVDQAERIGIQPGRALSVAPTEPGILAGFHAASVALKDFRAEGKTFLFTEEDEAKQKELRAQRTQ